jgi:hypothetical protein
VFATALAPLGHYGSLRQTGGMTVLAIEGIGTEAGSCRSLTVPAAPANIAAEGTRPVMGPVPVGPTPSFGCAGQPLAIVKLSTPQAEVVGSLLASPL